MKDYLGSVAKREPSTIKGIIAHELVLKGDPNQFFDDIMEYSFETLKIYKYQSFQFVLQHKEQFQWAVNTIETGDYSGKHIWAVFRLVAAELEKEVKLYVQRQQQKA